MSRRRSRPPGVFLGPNPDHRLNVGKRAWWAGFPPHDGGRSLYDAFGSYHGTLSGSAGAVTWKDGGVNLDGGTGYVGSTGLRYTGLTGSWCWAGTVTSYSAIGTEVIACVNYDGSSVPVMVCAGGQPAFNGAGCFNGGWNSSGLSTDIRGTGVPYRVLAQYDAGTGALSYVLNGRLDSTFTPFPALVPSTSNANPLDLGRYANDSEFFQGVIKDPGFWERALSVDERLEDCEQSLAEYRLHDSAALWWNPRAWCFGVTAGGGGGNRRRRVLICSGGG